MKKASDYKRYGEELGDILALMELINRYQSAGKKSASKALKQSDRPLIKLLKTQYQLSEAELEGILSTVAGKKVGTKRKGAVSEADKTALKKEIDETIAKIGITIRAQNLSEEAYLKKIKANLSVRKGKIMGILNPGREKRTRASKA